MRATLDEPAVNRGTANQTDNCRQDEEAAEMARKIERGIDEASAAISEKIEEGKFAAERLIRHSRYAIEDRLTDLTHAIKRHPIGFVALAFAAGSAVGLLFAQSSSQPNNTRKINQRA